MINSKAYRLILFAGMVLLLAIQSCSAQTKTIIEVNRIESLIDSITLLLNQYYVFPDVAKKIESHLKAEYAEGHFSNLQNDGDIAEKIHQEMNSIAHDLHLRFSLAGGSFSSVQNRKRVPNYSYQIVKEIQDFGFIRTGKMDNDIGYLEIRGFPPLNTSKPTIDEAMSFIVSSKVLIIDLRRNGGGIPETIKYICSYFFEKPTHINSIYWRYLDKTVDFITLENVGGKKMAETPIFVLTSSFTVSGGEEFAYNIQTQKRGLLIGEVTAGGANPSDIFTIDNFRFSIPTGRAINPITKTNWEGVGVKPDIEKESAEVLEYAHEKALLLIK